MQKSTTVFSVPLDELDEQLRDVDSWPAFLPGLESVRQVGRGRFAFTLRHGDRTRELHVAVRRSPYETGMLWTVLDGPAWNGHLYLQVVDARRTRVHLELNIEPHTFDDHLVEIAGGETRAQLGLFRLQEVVADQPPHDGDRVIEIPA